MKLPALWLSIIFFIQHGLPRKKQKPRTPAGFPVVHSCYPTKKQHPRGAVCQPCGCPGGPALAHRVLHEAGCTHGSQPGIQHGTSSPPCQHPRACNQRENPEQRQPSAAQPCPCTAAPCSPRCNPGFSSFFIYFFFLLFFPRAAAWPGTASPAQREDCTLRRNLVGDVQRWLATASTGEPPFSPLLLFSLSLPIYTCPRTELLQRSFFTTQITPLSTDSLLCLNCCYAEVPWALLVFLLFFFLNKKRNKTAANPSALSLQHYDRTRIRDFIHKGSLPCI